MPPSIRVLAVGNAYPPHHLGGYEVIWQGVMSRLRDEGHEVRILTTGHRSEAAREISEEPGVARELEWYWRDHEWRTLGLGARLTLERHNAAVFDRHVHGLLPDVVTWWPMGGMSLGLIERARRAGIPAVFFVLDPWLAYGPEHDLWMRAWRPLGPLAGVSARTLGLPATVDFAGAGRWIFCSRSLLTQTLAHGPRIGEADVLSPGVDRAFLDLPTEDEPPPWRWRLLYAGRVVEQKGVATLLEATARLPTSASVRIVGDGDAGYRSDLNRLAARLGNTDRVTFDAAQPRARMPEVYRSADATVFPVIWDEPWGLVPLEAMALGRPVVATGRGGSGDFLEHERNALLFDAGDAGALAAQLERLAGDAALRARLIAGGRATAEAHTAEAFNERAAAAITGAARGSGRTASPPPRSARS